MDEKVFEILQAKLANVDLDQLSIADLAGITLLGMMRRQQGQQTTEGQCLVKTVDGVQAAGWKCRCFSNGGITTHSFLGPGFQSWGPGGDGGVINGTPRFTVADPATGQVYFVTISCT